MPKRKNTFLTLIATYCILFALPTIANTHKELVFGFNVDGAPISYPQTIRGETVPNQLLGFCKHLATYLQQQGYTITTRSLSIAQRFEQFSTDLQGKMGILCGPNTITNERRTKLALISAEFSNPFVTTTAKVLMKATKIAPFYDKQRRDTLKVGFLSVKNKQDLETTSASIARSLNIQMVALSNRGEAIEYLQLADNESDAIDAYLSDEIILISMLQEENAFKKPQDFQLEPANDLAGYSWENFGLVTYNAPELTLLLNEWLASPAAKKHLLHYMMSENSFTYRCSINNDCGIVAKTSLWPLTLISSVLAMLFALAFYKWNIVHLTKLKREATITDSEASLTQYKTVAKEEEKVAPPKPLLTPAETKVCTLLIEGLSNKEMARALEVTPRTVEVHRAKIKTKIGLSPRELMKYAHQYDLIS